MRHTIVNFGYDLDRFIWLIKWRSKREGIREDGIESTSFLTILERLSVEDGKIVTRNRKVNPKAGFNSVKIDLTDEEIAELELEGYKVTVEDADA